MNLDNLRIAVSGLTDTVYLGKLSKDGTHWVGDKKDITNDFLKCIIDVYGGYSAEINGNNKRYKITVQEIEGD